MRLRKKFLLTLARGGMELSWRYAWVVFLTLVLTQTIFPPLPAVVVLVIGGLTTHIAIRYNLRNFQIVLLQSICFVLVIWFVLLWIQHYNSPILSSEWSRHLFLESKTPPQWVILLPFFYYMWPFWNGGRLLAKTPQTYLTTCMQFDKGLGLFILLLIIYALIDRRTKLNLEGQVIHYMILAFFVFSLIAIALARSRSQIRKSYMAGYHGIGVILSTLSMVAFFSAGTSLLAYPYLYLKADSLLVALQNMAGPFKPYLIKILIFLFHPRQIKLYADIQDENIPSLEEMGTPVVEGWQATLFKILGAGLITLMTLVALTVLVYGIIRLVQWLLKKKHDKRGDLISAAEMKRFLIACLDFLRCLCKYIVALVKGVDSAAIIYYRMLRWGKISGLVAKPSDTPKEYGRRLMQCFPDLKAEVFMIVEAFNGEIYGHVAAGKKTLTRLISAQRRMRRLRYWPTRMRIWFHHSE